MSTINDILFAPIHPAISGCDFLVRHSAQPDIYDWKPVSSRAISWMERHFACAFERTHEVGADGWANSFYSGGPNIFQNDRVFGHFNWFQELVAGDYSFRMLG